MFSSVFIETQENSYLVDGPFSVGYRNRLVAQDGLKDNAAACS